MLQTTYPMLSGYLRSFAPLSGEQLRTIALYFEPVRLYRGEWLLHEGQQCDDMYFVNSGMVRTVADETGSDVTAWVTLPGKFLTATYSYVKRKPSPVGLQAITRSEILRIHKDAVKSLYEQIPLLKDISLAIINEYYIDLERLYIFCLSHTARQRYANLHSYFPEHFFKVPLKYLASMIHVKPETLSRIRRMQQRSDDNSLFPGTA